MLGRQAGKEESWGRMECDAGLPDVLLRNKGSDGGGNGRSEVLNLAVGVRGTLFHGKVTTQK